MIILKKKNAIQFHGPAATSLFLNLTQTDTGNAALFRDIYWIILLFWCHIWFFFPWITQFNIFTSKTTFVWLIMMIKGPNKSLSDSGNPINHCVNHWAQSISPYLSKPNQSLSDSLNKIKHSLTHWTQSTTHSLYEPIWLLPNSINIYQSSARVVHLLYTLYFFM